MTTVSQSSLHFFVVVIDRPNKDRYEKFKVLNRSALRAVHTTSGCGDNSYTIAEGAKRPGTNRNKNCVIMLITRFGRTHQHMKEAASTYLWLV